MKQVRKYITFLLTLCMLLGMVLGSSAHSVESASENTENGNVVEKNMEAIPETPTSEFSYYQNGTKGIVITGYKGSRSAIRIPSKINGQAVVSIHSLNNNSITNVYIPASVKEINLSSDSGSAFSGCNNLSQIVIDEGNKVYSSENGMLYTKDKKGLLKCPHNKSGIVTVNAKTTYILFQAFALCENITEVIFPKGLTSIGDFAFFRCYKLKNISFPNSLKEMGEGTFGYCSSLTKIALPAQVNKIESAFIKCYKLATATVNSNNNTYSSENGVIYNKNKTSIVLYPMGKSEKDFYIPNGIKVIADGAFNGCKNLSRITVPKTVTEVGWNSFDECNAVIYGYTGSYIERYARSSNLSFIPISAQISYRTHVQNIGWQNYVSDGTLSGSKGKGFRLEGIQIRLDNNSLGGGIQYRTHVQNIGWQNYVSNGTMSGTSGKGLRLEAIQIRLTGEIAKKYNVYYRTHIQDYGWLGWAVNDGKSGSQGLAKRLEAIQIRLVEKGRSAPGSTSNCYVTNNSNKDPKPSVIYTTHVQNIGWQSEVKNGVMSGTKGKSLRLEAIKIRINGDGLSGGVEYSTHVQNEGWQKFVANGAISGTKGKSLRLEGIKIRLTGAIANKYSIEYRTHVQNEGWQGWVKDGAMSGTKAKSLRLEGIEIRLVKK